MENSEFKLEASNEGNRELINLVNETSDFESLADLAYANKVIGGKFNPLRYEYLKALKNFRGTKFELMYPEYNTETGILTDSQGNEIHITRVYDDVTEEQFFETNKQTIIDFLSLNDTDFDAAP